MSTMKKFTIVSGLASIVSLGLYFFPVPASSDSFEQNVEGQSNTVVGTQNGDITVNNYSSQSNDSEDTLVVNHPKGGGTYLMKEPDLFGGSQNFICNLKQGVKLVSFGETYTSQNGFELAEKVKVINGNCAGKVGWVGSEVIMVK